MGVTQVYNQVVNNIHNLVFLNRSYQNPVSKILKISKSISLSFNHLNLIICTFSKSIRIWTIKCIEYASAPIEIFSFKWKHFLLNAFPDISQSPRNIDCACTKKLKHILINLPYFIYSINSFYYYVLANTIFHIFSKFSYIIV